MSKLWRVLAMLVLSLLATVPALATESPEVESPGTIAAAVERYLLELNGEVEADTKVTVGQIDPRLRLARCAQELEVFLPSGQRTVGATTVGVRCTTPPAWTLYVQANVAQYRPVLIARRPLPRGSVLSAADVDLVERDVSRITLGYISNIKEIEGMVLKRSITGGMVLNPGLVQHPSSIRRGERVTILGIVGGIEVRMEGTALSDGAKGDVIQVRNLSSGRAVEGVVVAPGIVQVRL